MHSHNIYRTLEYLLKKSFQTHYKVQRWFHLNTNVNVAAFMLLATRHRPKQTQRTNAELSAKLVSMFLD